MKNLTWQGILNQVLMSRISEKFRQSILTVSTYRGVFFLNVSAEPCAFCLLVAGIAIQKMICSS